MKTAKRLILAHSLAMSLSFITFFISLFAGAGTDSKNPRQSNGTAHPGQHQHKETN